MTSGDLDPELLAALSSPESYPGQPRVEIHETHASRVFLAGDRAYKVKKPLALEFLDYSTLARRHSACREEVGVNSALAPDIYLGVRALVRTPAGVRLADEQARDALEYAIEMRRFSERDTLAGAIAAGALDREQVVEVARALARFHRDARIVAGWTVDRTLTTWRRNISELAEREHPATWRLDLKLGFAEAFLSAHLDTLERRARQGLIRDGHGDLRCEHVLVRPAVRVIDRIEFDPRLREIDVANDLAFLAMDLEALEQRRAAAELANAYREAGMDPGSEALRSFYAAHWALVRAKVLLIAASEHDADDPELRARLGIAAEHHAAVCDRLCWRARGPVALVVCGPAASGKSTLAHEPASRAELDICSSDVVRKRLAHVAPDERAREEHYSAQFTRATYEQLARDALAAVCQGSGVVVDATCRTRSDRAALLDGLEHSGVPFLVVRCAAPLELARARAAARLDDPGRISDATPAIVSEQFCSFEELDEVRAERVLELDTSGGLEEQVAAIARAIDASGMLA
jgi:aminoglycoside phosphotransferase family enzyme/predicted kinase